MELRATELLMKILEYKPFVDDNYSFETVCFMCHEYYPDHEDGCLWVEIEKFVQGTKDVETT